MTHSVDPVGTRRRIVVLASGEGTNLQAIIDACLSGVIHGQVVGVVSNTPSIGALRRAQDHDIATRIVTKLPGESRQSFDARLADTVGVFTPDWVVLAGFMRILSDSFITRFASSRSDVPSRIINLHPAAPGELPGIDAIERAFAEAQTGTRVRSGAMVHFVDSENVDCGPVITSVAVPILVTDTLDDFATRMHHHEHELLVSALQQLCRQPLHSEVSTDIKEPIS
ncbi:MAG: phosphoribosylglycinamide formyltransferase [Ilumatobacteraceae bacterium]